MPSTSTVQNPPASTETKSAKKKKTKTQHDAASPVPKSEADPEKALSASGDDGSESPYVRELQKNIRNINKKITNASKTDSLIAQHKDKSLEELVTAKIINADQRAQALKKPQLEAQLSQQEEQLAQYKKAEDESRARSAAEKTKFEKELIEKLEKEKADAVAEVTAKAAAEAKIVQHDSLLVLSQFLRLAAARRSEEADSSLDENKALEGVLLNVYSGDENAVATMVKLIEGLDEKTRGVEGDELETTFAEVKTASLSHVNVFPETEQVVETTAAPESDPTVIHAGLTEINATGETIPTAELPGYTNGHAESTFNDSAPANANAGDDAANTAAEIQWKNPTETSPSLTQEDWVDVPRDAHQGENGLNATQETNPVPADQSQSWADDHPDGSVEQQSTPAQQDDGFHPVQRTRPPRGGNESNWRGRNRGDYRGRGRGDGRGRGRGQGRGGQGGQRGGGRRNGDS